MRKIALLLFFCLNSQLCASDALEKNLAQVYAVWRNAMIRKDFATWQKVTALHRQVEVQNRIVSVKQPFPSSLFVLPTAPPKLDNLRFLKASRVGKTAKSIYYGPIDFGVGGAPSDNLLVLSFIEGERHFRYDRAEFVNLSALPEVRRELDAGDLSYLKGVPEAKADGIVPPIPTAVRPARTIAKVYVFSPGRDVEVSINNVSHHSFRNAKEAEIILGGALIGRNTLKYKITPQEGSTGKEALTIRVYFLSEVKGVKPLKAYEYLVPEGGDFRKSGVGVFSLDREALEKLAGK